MRLDCCNLHWASWPLRIFFWRVLPELSTSWNHTVRIDVENRGVKEQHTGIKLLLLQQGSDLLSVIQEAHANGDNDNLARRHPEWPLAGKVLSQNGSEALDTASHGTVDHDRAGTARRKSLLDKKRLLLLLAILVLLSLGLRSRRSRLLNSSLGLTLVHSLASLVLEGEVLGLLEVKLDGGALPRSVEAVQHSDINLGAVEGTITRVELPRDTTILVRGSKLVKSLLKTRLGAVPCLDLTKELFWASRKLELECEAEDTVELAHEVEEIGNFLLDLVLATEDVGIILLESSYSGETAERTAGFVTVEDTEIGKAEGKFLVTALSVTEHHGVGRAVHGLETELLLVHVKKEHVLLVMRQVARLLPKRHVKHIGSHDLVVATGPVLLLDVIHNRIVDAHTVGQPHGRTGRALLKIEQLLLLANQAVVALSGLLQKLLMGSHLLLVGKRYTVDSLKGVVVRITEEVRRRVLHDGKSLDSASVGDVGASAQIDQGAVPVNCGLGAILNLVLDDVLLVLVVGKHLEQVLLAHLESLERLLLLDHLADNVLKWRPVCGLNSGTIWQSHFVVETIVHWGTNAQRATEPPLAGLAKNMCAGMPEDKLALVVVEVQKLKLAALLKGTLEIPQCLAIDSRNNSALEEAVGDALGNFGGGGLVRFADLDGAIWHCDCDVLARSTGDFLLLFLVQAVEQVDTLLDEGWRGVHLEGAGAGIGGRGGLLLLLGLLLLIAADCGLLEGFGDLFDLLHGDDSPRLSMWTGCVWCWPVGGFGKGFGRGRW